MNTRSSLPTSTPFIGIDFGTTNSKMAWYNPRTTQAEIIRNAEGEEETPSVVHFGDAQVLVGSSAEEMLEYEQERDRVIISVKRELVSTPMLAVPGRSVKPVEVAAEILRKLRRDAEDSHFYQQVTRAVITYPASFGLIEQDKIRAAAHLAGFTEVEMLEEPVAAAIAYAQMGLKVGKSVLVYDLGGGTFDLAVLNAEDDGAFQLALDPQGIKRCGGDDFDEALYNHCNKIAQEKLGRPISLTGKRDLHFLQQCRQRKENLSTAEQRMFKSLLEPGSVLFQYEMTRTTFEGLISTIVEETVRKTKALLEQANSQGQTVDTMVLIGGSSRVPLVQRLLDQNLLLKPLQWQNRDVAVALGAAYYAQAKWGDLEEAWSNKTLEKTKIEHPMALANEFYLAQRGAAEVEPAPSSGLTDGTWQGQGSFYNGQSDFDMLLKITVNGNTFSGTLEEAIYSSAVAIGGSITSFDNNVTITFTSYAHIYGGRIALNCIYTASVSNGQMSGYWSFPGHSSPDGTFWLALSQSG